MKTSKIITTLKASLERYLFFWPEWTSSDECNLKKSEIDTVNFYLACNFQINFFERIKLYSQADELTIIIRKLNLGYQIFKDFVIVNFLTTVIKIANEYGYDAFLHTPISKLQIADSVKQSLLKFKVYTLHLVFIIYAAEDFNRGWIYSLIVEFQQEYKGLKDGQISKSTSYEIKK